MCAGAPLGCPHFSGGKLPRFARGAPPTKRWFVARERGGVVSVKKRKARFYVGVMPEAGGRWREVGAVRADGVTWCLFVDSEAKGPWAEVRIVAVGPAPNKASYWLGWSRVEKRFRKGGDGLKMTTHRAGLAAVAAREMEGVTW